MSEILVLHLGIETHRNTIAKRGEKLLGLSHLLRQHLLPRPSLVSEAGSHRFVHGASLGGLTVPHNQGQNRNLKVICGSF
jgi:hypothetical protein